jgi:3'(2'), 5'-bisphosphate nucleotidase
MSGYRDIQQRSLDFLSILGVIAHQAGEVILRVRAEGVAVTYKDDASPVTHADERANALIVAALERRFPGIPVISEEAENTTAPLGDAPFWLVDPLDGTKGFICGEDEFTVNIGLIEGRVPVAGAVYLPARGMLYLGSDRAGAFRGWCDEAPRPIRTRTPESNARAVLVSKHHASPEEEALLAPYIVTERIRASSSLKFCLLAEGTADLYPRSGPTMEWDTAAGHAILLAAGGEMTTLSGAPFLYGKPEFRNPGFLACGTSAEQSV